MRSEASKVSFVFLFWFKSCSKPESGTKWNTNLRLADSADGIELSFVWWSVFLRPCYFSLKCSVTRPLLKRGRMKIWSSFYILYRLMQKKCSKYCILKGHENGAITGHNGHENGVIKGQKRRKNCKIWLFNPDKIYFGCIALVILSCYDRKFQVFD